jgi:hypothetical protein
VKGRCILLLTESHDFEVTGCACGHGNNPESIFVVFFLRNSYCGFIGITVVFFLLARQPPSGPWPPPHSRGFLWFLDHTRHTTVGRTPLDE